MSLYDYFNCSISGLQASQALLDQAARIIADPASWGMESQEESSSYCSFDEYMANASARGDGTNSDPGGGKPPPSIKPLPVGSPLDGLGVGEGFGPQNILDAMICAMLALRMYQANARMIAIENKVVGIIIHLGEENYRSD